MCILDYEKNKRLINVILTNNYTNSNPSFLWILMWTLLPIVFMCICVSKLQKKRNCQIIYMNTVCIDFVEWNWCKKKVSYYDWTKWGSFNWVYMTLDIGRDRARPGPPHPAPTGNRSCFCKANNFFISTLNGLQLCI